jgi:hypothetical protein
VGLNDEEEGGFFASPVGNVRVLHGMMDDEQAMFRMLQACSRILHRAMTLPHFSDYTAPKALRLIAAPLDVFRVMSLPYYIRISKQAADRKAEKGKGLAETASFPPCKLQIVSPNCVESSCVDCR